MLNTAALEGYTEEILKPGSFVTIDPTGYAYPGEVLKVDRMNEISLVKQDTGEQHWYHWSSLKERKPDLRALIRRALQQGNV